MLHLKWLELSRVKLGPSALCELNLFDICVVLCWIAFYCVCCDGFVYDLVWLALIWEVGFDLLSFDSRKNHRVGTSGLLGRHLGGSREACGRLGWSWGGIWDPGIMQGAPRTQPKDTQETAQGTREDNLWKAFENKGIWEASRGMNQ